MLVCSTGSNIAGTSCLSCSHTHTHSRLAYRLPHLQSTAPFARSRQHSPQTQHRLSRQRCHPPLSFTTPHRPRRSSTSSSSSRAQALPSHSSSQPLPTTSRATQSLQTTHHLTSLPPAITAQSAPHTTSTRFSNRLRWPLRRRRTPLSSMVGAVKAQQTATATAAVWTETAHPPLLRLLSTHPRRASHPSATLQAAVKEGRHSQQTSDSTAHHSAARVAVTSRCICSPWQRGSSSRPHRPLSRCHLWGDHSRHS